MTSYSIFLVMLFAFGGFELGQIMQQVANFPLVVFMIIFQIIMLININILFIKPDKVSWYKAMRIGSVVFVITTIMGISIQPEILAMYIIKAGMLIGLIGVLKAK